MQSRGIYDFVGLDASIVPLLDTTGAKFLVSPSLFHLQSDLKPCWTRFERAVKLNAYFKVQTKIEEDATVADSHLGFLQPPVDAYPFDRLLLMGARTRRLHVDRWVKKVGDPAT